jgi:hypothetical protein
MLPAIKLDDQPFGKAEEVRDVEVDGNLAPEFIAVEAMRSKNLPKSMLSVGRF